MRLLLAFLTFWAFGIANANAALVLTSSGTIPPDCAGACPPDDIVGLSLHVALPLPPNSQLWAKYPDYALPPGKTFRLVYTGPAPLATFDYFPWQYDAGHFRFQFGGWADIFPEGWQSPDTDCGFGTIGTGCQSTGRQTTWQLENYLLPQQKIIPTGPPKDGDEALIFNVWIYEIDAGLQFPSADIGQPYQFQLFESPAVPEPATWMMLIVGFGMAGGLLRASRLGVRGPTI